MIDLGWIELAVMGVLPLIVGLVTTRLTPGRTKALLLAGLTAVSTIGIAVLDGGGVLTQAVVQDGFWVFIGAVGIHYGLWSNIGATDYAQDHLRTD